MGSHLTTTIIILIVIITLIFNAMNSMFKTTEQETLLPSCNT